MRRRVLLTGFLAVFMCSCACFGDTLNGRVVRVADGDTITVLDVANAQHKIRFHGIDAPEKGQAFGKAAGKFLAGLVAGRDVRVEYTKRDRYGRILGTVFCDERDINLEMLKAGYAWHYKYYDSNPEYAAAESVARVTRRGLWQDPCPVNPHEFRQAKKGSAK